MSIAFGGVPFDLPAILARLTSLEARVQELEEHNRLAEQARGDEREWLVEPK
ncbi:MAG: hypothetical protein Q7S02_01250 [bacterium]|nr:hypothetical protein [bacterium]